MFVCVGGKRSFLEKSGRFKQKKTTSWNWHTSGFTAHINSRIFIPDVAWVFKALALSSLYTTSGRVSGSCHVTCPQHRFLRLQLLQNLQDQDKQRASPAPTDWDQDTTPDPRTSPCPHSVHGDSNSSSHSSGHWPWWFSSWTLQNPGSPWAPEINSGLFPWVDKTLLSSYAVQTPISWIYSI